MASIIRNYNTEFGLVTVEEFIPPFSEEAINKIINFSNENLRKTYQSNYSMTEDPASLGYLLKNNLLRSAYIAYFDGKFQFFLATRITNDNKFLVLVRTFSKIGSIKKPIHTAFILRLQIQLAKQLGFKECSFTMNEGTRDGLARLVEKRYLNYKHEPNSIKALALENMSFFKYAGIQTINYCQQHVFTAQLDNIMLDDLEES